MAEASAAGRTRIGLLPGVDQHVRAQMRYLGREETSDRASRRHRTLPDGPPGPLANLPPSRLGDALRTCTKREPHVSHL